MLASCGAPEPPTAETSTPAPCTGKCDSLQEQPIPALTSLPLDRLVSCTITRDTSTQDDFFAADPITCQVLPLEGVNVELLSLNLEVWGADEKFLDSAFIKQGELGASDMIRVAMARTDNYPLTIKAHINWSTGGLHRSGIIDMLHEPSSILRQRLEVSNISRPDASSTHRFAPGFELWPVVVWPTTEAEAAWSQTARGLLNIRGKGKVELDSLSAPMPYDYNLFAIPNRTTSLLPLTALTMWLPTRSGEETVTFTSSLEPNDASSLEVTAPTYILLEADGSLTPATPTQVKERGAKRPTPAPTPDPTPDMSTAPVDGPDMSTPTPPPCGGQCDEQEVCVASKCIARSAQTQSAQCSTPTRACDPGEDSDCADDHVCVGGLCRRLSCQRQRSQSCSEPMAICDDNDDCAASHACVEGLCRNLACQTQSTFNCDKTSRACDPGEDSDCANGHVCVEGLCRNLECQTQSTFNCDRASRPCEGNDNGDCASNHVCVEGLCRNLECQTQSTFNCDRAPRACDPGEDSDCANGHVCVEGLCRNLECQTQSALNCERTPTRPCEGNDNGDCASNHVCVEGLCRNLECQTQSSSCRAPSRACDAGEITDCAPAHSCNEERLCARNSCAD